MKKLSLILPFCFTALLAGAQALDDARVFDAAFYLNKYSDLKSRYGNDATKARRHWLTYGIKEGRQAIASFDPRYYLTVNPDLTQRYGPKNYEKAIIHYLNHGIGEGRRGVIEKRPVYIIAHRCNSLQAIQDALDQGANAIECDVRWGRANTWSDRDWYVDHDGVYPHSVKLSDWLAKANSLANAKGNDFALIFFDIKDDKGTGTQISNELNSAAIKDLRNRARNGLPGDLNMVFSLAAYESREKFSEILGDLKSNEGVAIDFCNEPQDVQKYFSETKNVANFWYGNGINAATAYVSTPNLKSSIKKACQLRDSDKKIKKVYIWTLEKQSSIEEMISDYGVDAVLVNRNNNVVGAGLQPVTEAVNIVNQYAATRKATRADNPFQAMPSNYMNAFYIIKFYTGDVADAGTDANIDMTISGFYGNLATIKVNPLLSGNAFERSKTDLLNISRLDVGDLTSIKIKSDGKYAGAGWNLKYVEITNGSQTTYFPFNNWINQGEYSINGTTTFPYADYTFSVQTTDKSGAGTDSNITITLNGSEGSIGPLVINPLLSGDAFEKGDMDRFTLNQEKNIGALRSITVSSDKMYAGADWHLSYIEVNGKRAVCNDWINDKSSHVLSFQ